MSLFVLGGILLLAIIGHGYLWIDGVNRLHAWSGPRILIDGPTYVALLAFVALPLLIAWDWWHLGADSKAYVWSQSGLLPHYLQFCALWGAGRLILNEYYKRQVDHPQTLLSLRRQLLNLAPAGQSLPVSGTLTQTLVRLPGNQCLQLSIEHKRLAIPRLPSELEGFKIAHISDLHMIERIDQQWFEAVVDQVNQLKPDFIAITGDILERKACWQWLPETLGKLKSENGVYFILGNHDYFVDTRQTIQILREADLTYATGSWSETLWNGAPVVITGNERPWGKDELDNNPAPSCGPSQKPFKLVLAHSPDQFDWACLQDSDLVLAGHTHGGQIRFPVLGAVACPSLYGTRYACGVFRSGHTVMHVTRGVSGERPIRWNCPPELALLELARADGE